MIYFIQDKQYVKIGCTDNLDRRIKELQTATPNKLKLLLVMEGSFDTESTLHFLFASYRYRGEWFRYKDKLKYCIRGCIDTNNPYNADSIKSFVRAGMHLQVTEKFNRNKKFRDKTFKIIKGA
jgi:hypothetical protein